MGGGGGLGLFAGTIGSQKTDAFARGTLVAAAAQLGTVSDAGGTPNDERSLWRKWLDSGLPIWSFPYGHPEKTRRIEALKNMLKPRLEGYPRAYEWGILDPKIWILQEGIKKLRKKTQDK